MEERSISIVSTLTETKRIRKEGFEKKGAWFVTSNVEGGGEGGMATALGGGGRKRATQGGKEVAAK